MEPLILVDTDILIDVSRGIPHAVQKLEELDQTHILSLSVITKLELMIGCENKKEFKELNKFLDRFMIFHLSEAISIKAVELFNQYRLSHGVLIADMLIASTALIYDIDLISKNKKDFKFIEDLKLMKYSASWTGLRECDSLLLMIFQPPGQFSYLFHLPGKLI